jgi:nucleotide-binding universal stress UspA family protein
MTTRTHGIVIAYDGSAEANEAARWAAGAALLRGVPLQALVVTEPLDSPHSQGWPDSWWDDIVGRAREVLDASGAPDATVERHFGRLVPTLLDASRDAAMLVLGSRGHSRIGEVVIGSVSQTSVRRSRIPVVVVRERHDASSRRIVVGSDDSEPSRRALDFACAQASATGHEVVLLRAWKPFVVPVDKHGDVPPSLTSRLLEEEELLAKSVAEARGRFPHIEIDGEFIATSPGQALVDSSYDASLIAVGNRGHTALAETVLGSVSHKVLHEARCPVAVVH